MVILYAFIGILSLSARRAWIEIVISAMTSQISVVALRKESVDRNIDTQNFCISIIVALRKESVDRNMISSLKKIFAEPSLSARRAWIEIVLHVSGGGPLNCRSPQGERG